jgi:D,D-heptose 1,7-bisphosphate phosphatase
MPQNKACFLDRDGVLIEEKDYLCDPDGVVLADRLEEIFAHLRARGYKVIIISNQAGIAKGYFKEEQLKAVQQRIDELLAQFGEKLDGVYYCYHHAKGVIPEYTKECNCRKPAPGMILQAAKDHDIDLSQSVMIGDRVTDVQAGINAGCRAVALVRTGHGAKEDLSKATAPVTDAPDIYHAVMALIP